MQSKQEQGLSLKFLLEKALSNVSSGSLLVSKSLSPRKACSGVVASGGVVEGRGGG